MKTWSHMNTRGTEHSKTLLNISFFFFSGYFTAYAFNFYNIDIFVTITAGSHLVSNEKYTF